MNLSDTIQLLKECNAGSKMAVSSIDEMLDKIKSGCKRNVLGKNEYENGNERQRRNRSRLADRWL